jgi:hypothetical protein
MIALMPFAKFSSLVTVTANATYSDAVGKSSYTFSGVSFGTENQQRYVIVSVYGSAGTAPTSATVTIGGVSATALIASNSRNFYIAKVPTGTSGTVVVTFSSATNECVISSYSVVGLQSTTPVDTKDVSVANNTTISTTINVSSNGFVLGLVGITNSSPLRTTTWTGLNKVGDTLINTVTAANAFQANLAAQTGRTVTSVASGGTPDQRMWLVSMR